MKAKEAKKRSEAEEAEALNKKEMGKKKNKKEEVGSVEELQEKMEELESEIRELRDKNVRLYAEFDNFRKRSIREREELIELAGKEVIQALLPVLDDIKHAEEQIEQARDVEAVKEGYQLIIKKLIDTLERKGLKEMKAVGEEFNPDLHEAIAELPAPAEEHKGKIIDEVNKGYYLNDKLLRHAKVVVGK
jgi:molecular chaperone GrpE